ncbi:MAG TPA: hypothetical protein RMH99_28125 [Sandaracinaceae bacterium LLY-WYZ-13_1]|nr:hypothetical protein [Sandaracinaceae bacterium LLY-WYZ-13_1]
MSAPRARAGAVGVVAALLGVLVAGCVDTELGLDAMIDAASVRYEGGIVSATVDVTYRVGEHADGARQFQPQAIDLFVGEELVVSLAPSVPMGFVAVLEPGDSASATLEAGLSGADDPTRLCGAEVRVVFRWMDQTTLEVGTTEITTTDVACP